MTGQTHLRPREKIAERAVHALTQNELLQVIIGSGSAQYPVRYIARRVQSLLKDGIPSIQTLRQVSGIGEALATRLVAVFEFAGRLSSGHLNHAPSTKSTSYVEVTYLDVSRNELSICRFNRNESNGLLLQRICQQAIVLAASRVSIHLKYDDSPRVSVLDDLCFVRELHNGLSLLGVLLSHVQRQWGSNRKELL